MFRVGLLIFCAFTLSEALVAQKSVPVSNVAENALQKSQLTWPGSKPFHLKAVIAEKGQPDSEYQATIEEFWVSPDKWRRTTKSQNFSQTRVVNKNITLEENSGGYFPVWINNTIAALFDPLPMLPALKQSKAQVGLPLMPKNAHGTFCADFPDRLDRWVICFRLQDGLLSSVFRKGYGAEFSEYRPFGEKSVACLIVDDPEPGTTLETRIVTLEELRDPDPKLFEVPAPTPITERIDRIRLTDDYVRKIARNDLQIAWPSVGEGLLNGGCAAYISADKTGQVREAWPAGCDNPGLQDPLREALLKWRLTPTMVNGAPVQVEALMGFTFHTQLETAKALPLLTNEQVRSPASNIVEPKFPPDSGPAGTEVIAQISVDQTGKFTGISNTHHLSDPIFLAIASAVTQWKFQPYIKDGKPQYFHADVSFRLN